MRQLDAEEPSFPLVRHPLITTTGSQVRCIHYRVEYWYDQSAWIRPLAFIAPILFLVSWVFPAGAGLAKDISAFPKWWGAADVGLAFILAIVAFGIQTHARGKVDRQAEDTTYRVHRTTTPCAHSGGGAGDAGREPNHMGELRYRFPLARVVGLVHSPLVVGSNALSRDWRVMISVFVQPPL